jgi:hypothetical protein
MSQGQWLIPVILATQKMEIRRIAVQGQAWAKTSRHHISAKKRHGGAYLTSQLCGKHKEEYVSGQPGHNYKFLFQK